MLTLPQTALDALHRHGEEAYPHECCGVLLGEMSGDERKVSVVVRATNTRDDAPHNRYHIDPKELIRIQRQAREQGLDIVGFYHSHPDHPPRWSATDLAEAHWVGCSYVITSVERGKAGQTKSFVLAGSQEEDKEFRDEEIQVRPESPSSNHIPSAAREPYDRDTLQGIGLSRCARDVGEKESSNQFTHPV